MACSTSARLRFERSIQVGWSTWSVRNPQWHKWSLENRLR